MCRRALATLFPLFISLGCGLARTELTFRTVDAVSGQPLGGVKTSASEGYIDILFGKKRREIAVAPTGPDGIVRAKGLHKSWGQEFVFQRWGYRTATAFRNSYAGEGPLISIELPPTDPRHEHQLQFAHPRDGVFEIPMYAEGEPRASEEARPQMKDR